ncbi:MAG: ChbG/HpnK family deacetylase [Candidatus Woesearchaeota archaeon]
MKYLILNADDFGYSKVFNDTILELLEKRLVTSTTVMVKWVDEQQQKQVEKLINLSKSKEISVGLHLELIQGDFTSQIKTQYDKFISIFGFKPSHLDVHKFSCIHESLPDMQRFCIKYKLPSRNHGLSMPNVLMTKEEKFDGTYTTYEELLSWIEKLKDEETYEVMFHPGKYDPNSKSTLNKDREKDVEKIKKLNDILFKYNIKLISYIEFAAKLR